ncbi:hypothetical protein ACNKHP_15435 [Shigella boydii]
MQLNGGPQFLVVLAFAEDGRRIGHSGSATLVTHTWPSGEDSAAATT